MFHIQYVDLELFLKKLMLLRTFLKIRYQSE
jgi:hypothetical protein